MVGKVPPDDLAAHVLGRTGSPDGRVRQGPAYGEDAAAVDLGEHTLVVSADPISLAAERVGTLGVPVACNDLAASGAEPAWLTVVTVVPADDPAVLEAVAEQLHEAALEVGVSVVGGHSEYNPELSRPLLSLTALGPAERFVPTAGAEPGDRVLVTKGAGVEGTAILASDFREAARERGVREAALDRAVGFFEEISVLPEARLLRERATAMHDPTEGGLVDGLFELASAADADVAVERDRIPVREETRALCDAMDVDPLCIFGSGALVATVPPDEADVAFGALEDAGIATADIGEVRRRDGGTPALVVDGERFEEPVRDDLYALWEQTGG
jgi:hydrogenase expression/formation protein HypE